MSDHPNFCTVTVTLSTGEHQSFDAGVYVQNPGDMYVYTQTIGVYRVEVTVNVKAQGNKPACTATLGPVQRA